MEDRIYPFSAIYKQDLVKKAILLNLINPAIGGVMIDGSCGSAKSSIIRSIGSITEKKLCEVPANVSEDRMLGNLAIDKALKSGEFVFENGILAEADGQILIADDIHLLTDNIADILVIALADKFISV